MNEDFRYIMAIAEHGSISKAARAVHISQPGLSQRLRRLEAAIGAELFDRSHTPLKPTEVGKVYLKHAHRALASEEAMRREVNNAARSRQRRLRIGVSMPRANALLAEPVVSFYATYHGCTVDLVEMINIDQMHRLFMGNEVDFAVLTPISPDPSAYDLDVLCHERLVVIASEELRAPQFARIRSGHVGITQLEGLPFVLPTCGDYYDPMISHIIDSSNAQLETVVRNCSAELALQLVRDGLGVSIVPSTWVVGTAGLRTFDIAGVQAGAVLRYIRRRDHPASEEERHFMAILRKHLSECLDDRRKRTRPIGLTG